LLFDAAPTPESIAIDPSDAKKSNREGAQEQIEDILSQYMRQVPDVPETGFHPTRLIDVLAHGLDNLGPQMNNARFRPPYYLDSSDPHVKAANCQNIWKICT
jgi:hypothetical protein